MKEVFVLKKTVAFLVALVLSLSLVACGGAKPASSVAAKASSAPAPASVASSKPASVSEAATEMSVEDAKTLLKEKIDAGMNLLTVYMGGSIQFDEKSQLAGNTNYCLVTDENYKSIADLKAATEKVYSKKIAEETLYMDQFDGENARFKEADGKLYVNQDIGGKGISAEFDVDTLTIVSQTPDTMVVSMDYSRFDEAQGKAEITLVKENDNWVLDSKIDI